MIKFLADENFNNQIVKGVLGKNPDIDMVRVQDVGLKGADDPLVFLGLLKNENNQDNPSSLHGEVILRR